MNQKSILLVEDDPGDVKLTLHAFKKFNVGNQIHVARDGAEALDYLFRRGSYAGLPQDELPTVVLLDLKLPKVDGLEVLRQIRANPRTKRLPVVVLTSSKEDRDLTASYDGGANSYVRKPVDFDEFTQAARSLGLYWLLLNEVAPPANP